MSEAIRVGLVGCGAISARYLEMARRLPGLEVVACADVLPEKAMARAEEFDIPRAVTVAELLHDDAVEVVLNLTVPRAHAPIALEAIAAGKHTFAEKPLGVSRAEGRAVLDAAAAAGVRVGCAPDTFLGAGIQTARKVLDAGAIGCPVGFTAAMLSRGHESWHQNPGFFYEPGGGPMFDMGPYYVTALLYLLGPLRRVMGFASIAIPDRVITSQARYGERIRVETPDHIFGLLEFENGAVGTLVTSFATAHAEYDRKSPITIFGTEGTLRVPDPNTFDGPVYRRGTADTEWEEVPHQFLKGYGRAIGLADLAAGLRRSRPHRCSGEQAFAVLDAMQAFLDSSQDGHARAPEMAYVPPAPMPADLPFGELD
ncbi:MAG: Gfo/Idh/MocA family oxidoreductase [Armatimonadetes bacterium]|nr:Gfo/Idh/MocA family oxidoreductase [Armatimonadota bacterium]